jgi:hypothetical protein
MLGCCESGRSLFVCLCIRHMKIDEIHEYQRKMARDKEYVTGPMCAVAWLFQGAGPMSELAAASQGQHLRPTPGGDASDPL